MGSSAGPTLLKAWLSWLKGNFLLRLLGVPAALLALHLEIYGSSPATTSLLLHRLSRRLRLTKLTCMLKKDDETGMNSIFFVGGADVMDRAQSQRRPPSLTRKRSMTPADKERTQPGASSPKQQPPRQLAAAADASPSPSPSSPSPSPSPSTALRRPSLKPTMSSHTRSMSHAGILRQKRLSLQFPIQPAAGSISPGFSPRSRPQSWVATPSPAPSPGPVAASESNILAIIAAQERYVLELKEELANAEKDLKTLKEHFRHHEVIKQANDALKVTQLQPLNTALANYGPDQDDEDGSALWMQKEMERRKSLLSGTKSSSRKTISGSRHLRQLSLLSPDKNYTPSFPQPLDVHEDEPTPSRPPPLARATTSPDIANHIARTVNGERYDLGGLSNIQRDALLRTGKQMASDLKSGLLTFIEDIRQATVGDEPVNGAEGSGSSVGRGPSAKGSRKASETRPALNRAASSKKSATSKTGDIGDDFWKEHGLSEPTASPTNKKTHALKNTNTRTPRKQAEKTEDFEEWDSWDTPNDKYINAAKAAEAQNSSDESEPSSPVSGQASSRTSTRYHSQRHDSKASSLTMSSSIGLPEDIPTDSKRSSIPWPDIVKLSPTNLKRTASHLMKEWEKNLTPPPEARESSHSSGDYIGRSVSPTGLP